jgi:hypothetical protein
MEMERTEPASSACNVSYVSSWQRICASFAGTLQQKAVTQLAKLKGGSAVSMK